MYVTAMALLAKLIYFVFLVYNVLYLRVALPVGVVVLLYLLWKRFSPFAQQR